MIRLFSVFIPTSILGLLISEILIVGAIYLGSIYWQFDSAYFYVAYEGGALQATLCALTIIAGLYLSDCYERVRLRSRLVFAQQLCIVVGVAFLIQALFAYGRLNVRMPRQAMLFGSSALIFLLPLWRTCYSRIALQMLGAERLLFVGTHPLNQKLIEHLNEHPEFAMKPIGVVAESAGLELAGAPTLGTIGDFASKLPSLKCDRIVAGIREEAALQASTLLIQIKQKHFRIDTMADTFENVFGRVAISELQPEQVIFKMGLQPSLVLIQLQTIYSWLIALAGFVIFSPILLVTALAVRVTSPGPVLFRQTRTGKDNAPFMLYKFRSMYADAEARTGAVWAQENDPRVTPVGRTLRKYRLDELPQLFNVLRGEMAIVGPRPERPEFISMLSEQIPFYMQRLSVKPGITGWAQINYRYGNSVEDTVIKLEYDLYYVKNLSPQLDFYVMFHTVKTMLLTRGAY